MQFTLGVIPQVCRTSCVRHEHAHVRYMHEHGLQALCEPMLFMRESYMRAALHGAVLRAS